MSEEVIEAPATEPPTQRRGISVNGLVLLGVTAILGGVLVSAPDAPPFVTFLFVLCAWMTTVAVHEFGHALAAYHAGDHTVAAKGYLSFDPLKYTDLWTSLFLPILALALGGIGFPGGAVYLRDDLMRSRWGRAFASLAGPLSTLVCLVVLAAGFHAAYALAALRLAPALALLAFLQATGLVINLLPIPGLDGFGVIRPFLPKGTRRTADRIGHLAGFFLLA